MLCVQVRHFAGNVCYMGAHFLDKNNDTLHADFESALCAARTLALTLTLTLTLSLTQI